MNLSKRLLSLLLVLVMVFALAACSSGDKEPDPSPSFVPDTSVEDLILATAGIPADFELLTINGHPVTARLYMYWVTYGISYLQSLGFNVDLASDATLTDYLRSDALNAATQYTVIAAKASELNCTMTQEQKEDLDSSIAIVMATMGGEEPFMKKLFQNGLDYDSFYFINSCSYYFTQLEEALYADRPTDDEVAEYIEENDVLYAKHILLLTKDMSSGAALDEETVAQKKATAEDILTQLQSSEDLPTAFDTLMNEYSEDTGLAAYPDGYTFTAGEMVTEFEEGTRALEYGQISGIIESPYGYHIILRLDPNDEALRSEIRAGLMNEQLIAWIEEAEIETTEEYEALDLADFYNKFVAYQQAFKAEAEAESETEGKD